MTTLIEVFSVLFPQL